MSENLSIWNVLSKTNPEHTKAFQRAGGFKGTAIKPVYTELKMTEMFGPCGTGWGYSEPTFQLVNGPEGEVAVYCWLSLWYRTPDGVISDPIPGVGGDFAVKKNKYGIQMDDEAFKKAATDALGNAMKHLGMSADVHMGRFDDSKYVDERKREEANGNGNVRKSSAQAKRDGDWEAMQNDLRDCGSAVRVQKLWDDYKKNTYPKWNQDWRREADELFAHTIAKFSTGDDLAQTLEDSVAEDTAALDALRDELIDRMEAMESAETLLRLRDSNDFKSARARLPEAMQTTIQRHGASLLKKLPAEAV